ncbi:unnamed protein product [Parascedosporium putredinis]|uniref:RRM domain-containing protein n=1 Tax=Parascedosporium putredinis TaxID=1442378 RepID=A0A9P1H830_9PEZI|nr:unnamed protein product [Parascedosporium putredinis]CAI8002012.1 unnamed protein product [Parascedosporium putredinis]
MKPLARSRGRDISVEASGSNAASVLAVVPNQKGDANLKKRKREADESDPTFREFLEVMQPNNKRATGIDVNLASEADRQPQVQFDAGESDDEYEAIPSKRQPPNPQALPTPHFEKFGAVEEVHLPVDVSRRSKGYALVLYANADAAIEAFQNSDGIPFQGRILHIVPAAAKRDNNLDEFALSKLPLKKQNLIRKRAEAASNTFNWNSLYMNQDAVNASIANRLGISKAELLDPTSADAGVKQAIAETTVIQETKAYFESHGVDLDAFKSNKRGETAILVKNFPFGTTIDELRTMFEEHGTVLQVLMPPSGTIAIVQFAQAADAKWALRRQRRKELANAFSSLDGFVSARVKTKTDAKKPGQILSMGFGFVEFRTKPQAMAAIKSMDGFVLAGHTLAVKASHRGLDAAEERRREDAAKKAANLRTKIVIKNLPFEATKKDVRALFSTYGELRAAENAISALKDTHLLGRKLVIDFAEAETIDAEEEIARMQKKIGGQVNKVTMQQLTNRGRTKVNIGNEEDDMDLG